LKSIPNKTKENIMPKIKTVHGIENRKVVSQKDWLVAVALGRWIHELTAGAQNGPEQRRALLSAAREVNQLRRGDHEEQSLRIQRERWQAEQAATEAEKRQAAKMAPLSALLLARGVVDLYKDDLKESGGKVPAELKAFFAATAKVRETQNGPGDCKPQEIPPADQTESNPIQPNQTTMTLRSRRPCRAQSAKMKLHVS
jgi:hypothetical protein